MNLLQDEKNEIYEEENKEKEIFINDGAFVNRAWVGSTIAAVASLFLFIILVWNLILSILLGSLLGILVGYLLPLAASDQVFFNCPYCNYLHHEGVDSKSKFINGANVYYKCSNCKRVYHISVSRSENI